MPQQNKLDLKPSEIAELILRFAKLSPGLQHRFDETPQDAKPKQHDPPEIDFVGDV